MSFLNCITIFLFILLPSLSYSQEFQWVKEISEQSKSKSKLTTAENDNLILAENFIGTISFGDQIFTGKGYHDFVLVKYDVKGRIDWIKQFGTINDEEVTGLVSDPLGNIFITGFFKNSISFGSISITAKGEQDVFLAKLDKKGNCQWAMAYGTIGNDNASGLSQDTEGNLIISGAVGAVSSNDNSVVFISKFDPFGILIWSKNLYSADKRFESNAVISNHSNDIIIAGRFYSNLFFENAPLFTEENIVDGLPNLFLLNLDKNGNLIWSNRLPARDFDSYISIESALTCDEKDNIYLGASYIGNISIGENFYTASGIGNQDIFLASCTKNGTWRWVQTSKGDVSNYGRDYFISLKSYPNGILYGSGYFDGKLKLGAVELSENKSLYDSDIFVISIDTTGNILWGKEAGAPSTQYFSFDDRVYDLTVNSRDEIFLTGNSSGNAKFDKIQLKSSDKNIGYFAKIIKQSKTALKEAKVQQDTILVSIYPNPAFAEDINVKMEGTGEKVKVYLYDNLGNMVLQINQGKTRKKENYQFVIKTSELKDGLYLLKLISGDVTSTYKIIITK